MNVGDIYITPRQAILRYGTTSETLRRWSGLGRTDFITTPGGHRRYKIDSLDELFGFRRGTKPVVEESDFKPVVVPESERELIIYARVSSRKQAGDLTRQIEVLRSHYPTGSLYKDIGSGMSDKRMGFRKLVESVLQSKVSKVVVTHRDRLSRFGFDFLVYLFSLYGTEIVVVSESEDAPPEREFVDDLLSIITFYTAKYYGSRKNKPRPKDPVLPESKTEDPDELVLGD